MASFRGPPNFHAPTGQVAARAPVLSCALAQVSLASLASRLVEHADDGSGANVVARNEAAAQDGRGKGCEKDGGYEEAHFEWQADVLCGCVVLRS